jgi:methionyl-tRNA formyltransferase
LRSQDDELVGLVLHPSSCRSYGKEIEAESGLHPERIFDGSQLERCDVLQAIRALGAEIALSVFFGYVMRRPFLTLFPRGVVNLHPALLPYNRGAHPNVWSIVEETPAGVTLHYVDERIDTGDIISQQQVVVESADTGERLYRRLEQASLALLEKSWPLLKLDSVPREPQSRSGTTHRAADLARIDRIELEESYRARDLINLLRARTFPPHKGAYFLENGRRVYLRLELEAE